MEIQQKIMWWDCVIKTLFEVNMNLCQKAQMRTLRQEINLLHQKGFDLPAAPGSVVCGSGGRPLGAHRNFLRGAAVGRRLQYDLV